MCCGDGQRAVCLVLCCVVVTVIGLCVLWWYVLCGLSEDCVCCDGMCCRDCQRAVCVVVTV